MVSSDPVEHEPSPEDAWERLIIGSPERCIRQIQALEAVGVDLLLLASAPIGVSVVCPGLIDTNIMRSSRNRPAELSEEGKAGPMAQAFGQALADRLAGGYPPSEEAEQVIDGIREDRFYIVPAQPEVKSGIAIRAQDLLELRNPTLRLA